MADLYGATFTGTYDGYSRKFRSYLHYTVGQPSEGKVVITLTSAGLEKTSGGSTGITTSGNPTVTVSLTGQTSIAVTSTSDFNLNGTAPVDHDFFTNRSFTVNLTTEPQVLTLSVEYKKSSGAWKGSSKGSVQITVPASYGTPTINNLVAYRSDTRGNPVANGTAITVKCQASGGSGWTYDRNNTLIKVNGTSKSVSKSYSSDPFSATTSTGVVAQGSSATIELVFAYRDAQTSTVHTITVETYITAVDSVIDAWYDSNGYHLNLHENTTIGGNRIVSIDPVIEEGTSGSWKYRKWNSGTVEAWASIDVTRSASTTVKANYFYRGNLTASIPSGIFTATPTVVAQLNDTYDKNLGFHFHATSATALEGRVMAYASFGAATVPMNIYAIGT